MCCNSSHGAHTYDRIRMEIPGEIFCVDGCMAGKFVVTVLALSRESSCADIMAQHTVRGDDYSST